MQGYDFHIHGKPYSQDVWKNDDYSDYLSSMYSNEYLNAASDESYMIIEIYNKTLHYTYMRSKGIRDNAERDGSFFAITISFKGQCCSVAPLFNLLDQIYNKIAKPSFFVQSKIAGCLKYKVLQLEDANVMNQMQLAFDKNVMYLNLRDISNLTDTIHSNETRIISLRDVDSPEFLDMLLKNRLIVSPKLVSAIKRCGAIESELAKISSQNQILLSSKERLQSDIATLTEENKSLSNKLLTSASSTEKKFKSKLEQLQNDLANVTNERNSLKQKIQEATTSIELIDQPFQKLTHLIAGRFPESRSQICNNYLEDKQAFKTKSHTPFWIDWLNCILLGIVLVCCCVILFIVLKSPSVDNSSDINPKSDETPVVDYSESANGSDIESEDFNIEQDKQMPVYDSWEECFLNIKGGGDNLKLNEDYTLSVTKNGKPANIPNGYWSVYINNGEKIDIDNSFKITDPTNRGKKVTIEYIINGQSVKQRVCNIQ